MSYLESIGSTTMKVYKDESCSNSELLAEYNIDFKVLHFEDAAEFDRTVLFELLCEVEDEYSESWAAVAIYDGYTGAVLYRNKHYLLSFDYKPKLSLVPRIIYFDVSDTEFLKRAFETAIVYEIDRRALNDVSAFIFGSDGFIWRLVEKLNFDYKQPYENAVVVMAHEEKSEIWYSLDPEHRGMIRIKSAQHLEELEKLAVGLSLSREMFIAAYDCESGALFYGMDVTLYEHVQDLANKEILRIRTRFEADYV